MFRYDAACRAIIGARARQEDAAGLWPGPRTFEGAGDWPAPPADGSLLGVLADGMGGHTAGNIASESACDLFVRAFATLESDVSSNLLMALHAANQGISEIVSMNTALSGMGCTLVGFVITPDGLEWVSVGDSPMYIVRQGEIALINEDHSLAPALDQLVADGKLTEDEARNDPRRHMLRSALSGDVLDLIDVSESPLRLMPGDVIVTASDGILTLRPEEICRVTTGYADAGAQGIVDALLREVESQREPMQDNTTVIAVRITGR